MVNQDFNAAILQETGHRPWAMPRRAWLMTQTLYNVGRSGRPYRLEIHHPPWPLQPAHVDLTRNTMAPANGLALPAEMPLLHFARRQDVVAWGPSAISSAAP